MLLVRKEFKLDDKDKKKKLDDKETTEVLLKASESFQQNLIIPIEELFQRLNVRINYITEVKKIQNEIIQENFKKIENLQDKKKESIAKIDTINKRFERLTTRSEEAYRY